MSAHFKLGLGDSRDDDGFPVVYGAGLHQQHLPILIDQHLHLLGVIQGVQYGFVKQDASFLQAEGQLQRLCSIWGVSSKFTHTFVTSPVS